MAETTSFTISTKRNPDVLTCIANLSNDEVFTPPEFARQMLDSLADAWADDHNGETIWADKTVTFLDPSTKSGVFLREITQRLVKGLAREMPDIQGRVDHILTKQVFGIGITNLTAMLARRSLYCSKWANGPHSITTEFDDPDGNIWFQPVQHSWIGGSEVIETADHLGKPIRMTVDGRCKYCGASQKALDRAEGLETHAYAFIHTDDTNAYLHEIFGADMQFDVIIGNPPYQLDDGGYGASAAPIYQHFVERSLDMEPRYAAFVTPSRWFAGGKGLDAYRDRMLRDRRLRKIVDYPKLYDGFPGVKIRGGISYFLWDRDYEGPCTIQTMWDAEPLGKPVARFLDAYDVLIRRNEAVSILDKVVAKDGDGSHLSDRVSSQKPFGFRTFVHGEDSPKAMTNAVRLFGSQKVTWVERSSIPQNADWVDDWKVLMTRVQGTSAAVETMFLSRPIVAGPGTACTETYVVAGRFPSKHQAENYAAYLRTRLVRFLVSLRKTTQDAAKGVYAFVPDLPLNREWTDEALYRRYGLTDDEIEFIESTVRPMTDASELPFEDGDD